MSQTLVPPKTGARIAALGYDYKPTVTLEHCNLCGGTGFVPIAQRDRYGFPATAVGCLTCGLVFLNPRLSAEAYRDFYQGTYRALISALSGATATESGLRRNQIDYGQRIMRCLMPFSAAFRGGRHLDIGASRGDVADVLQAAFATEPTLLDPSVSETNGRDHTRIVGSIEDADLPTAYYGLVTICRTLDHVLDAKLTLAKARAALLPAGVLFVDIVDFRFTYRLRQFMWEAVKIDHPYYFTEETAETYLRMVGLEVFEKGYHGGHVWYVCGKGEPMRFEQAYMLPLRWSEARAAEVREKRDWRA